VIVKKPDVWSFENPFTVYFLFIAGAILLVMYHIFMKGFLQ